MPNLIQAKDKMVLSAISRGQTPDLEGIADPVKYFSGLLHRQGFNKSWAVAGALAEAIRNLLNWHSLEWLARRSYLHFEYSKAQEIQDALFALNALELNMLFYNQGRRMVAKGYDDYGYPQNPDPWDVEQANQIQNSLQEIVNLAQTLRDNPPPAVEGVDSAETIAETLPLIQSFLDFLPEFMDVLDQHKILDISSRPFQDMEMPQLEIALPNSVAKAYLPVAQMLDKQTVQRGVADFQGFCIGLVQEPGAPDDRDLHMNWASKEDIEKACDKWAFLYSRVGIKHEEFPEDQGVNHPHFVILRNWIQYGDTTIGGQFVKDGSWLQAYQAVSDWAVQALENYEINGLSPGGSARFVPDQE